MFRFLLSIVLAIVLFVPNSVEARDARPFTIEDILSLEAVGDGAASKQQIVWEQAPPYQSIGYYGQGLFGTWDNAGFVLKSISLEADNLVSESLFEQDDGATYWLDSISPGGRYVVYYAAKDAQIFMGAYDNLTKRVHRFEAAPLVHHTRGHKVVWVSQDEFIFSAHSDREQPLLMARPYTTRKLLEESEKSWRGEVGVSISVSGSNDVSSVQPNWKEGRLYRANARTGDLSLLAEGLYKSLKVSADGQYLAALRQAELPSNSKEKSNDDWVTTKSQLYVFDLINGQEPKVFVQDKNIMIETLAWSPSQNLLAFFGWENGTGVQSGVFHALSPKSGQIIQYPHRGLDLASERERGFAQKPERVMWVDGRLAVFARPHEGEEALLTYRDIAQPGDAAYPGKADWILLDADGSIENLSEPFAFISPIPLHADEDTITVLADGDVWRLGPGLEPLNLTSNVKSQLTHPDAVRYSTFHLPFTDGLVLVGRDQSSPSFVLVDLESDSVTEVMSPTPHAEFVAGSIKASALLFRYEQGDVSYLTLKFANGREVEIDQLNTHLIDIARTEWGPITYELDHHAGERTVGGCILLPPDYEPGKKYPVIASVYPNVSGDWCKDPTYRSSLARRRPSSSHLLAGAGYIVFSPNTLREFIRTSEGPINGMPAIVEQGLDALIEQGYADPERLGLFGFSQGGFASLYVGARSERFHAVVSMNGWADMYSHFFDGASFLNAFYEKEYGFTLESKRYMATAGTEFSIGASPFANPDSYVRNSPLYHAQSVSSPMLLIHSDRDVFALNQYEKMFAALEFENKEARLLRYWGEGHAPSSPGNLRHMWSEILDWFDKHLSEPSSSP